MLMLKSKEIARPFYQQFTLSIRVEFREKRLIPGKRPSVDGALKTKLMENQLCHFIFSDIV